MIAAEVIKMGDMGVAEVRMVLEYLNTGKCSLDVECLGNLVGCPIVSNDNPTRTGERM